MKAFSLANAEAGSSQPSLAALLTGINNVS